MRRFSEESSEINNSANCGKRYIIRYKESPTRSDINDIFDNGGHAKYQYSKIKAVSAKLTGEVMGVLKKNPNIISIEPNLKCHTTAQEIPWGITRVRAPEVWPTGNKGTGVKVGIIDTGIDYNHEDLAPNYKGGYNCIYPIDATPFDDAGHGSHVAGIIGAVDNDKGVVGVAPEAHLYAVKALNCAGGGYTDDLIAALEWCIDNQMDVINMSWGYGLKCDIPTDTCKPRDPGQAMADAIRAVYNAGILQIAAAGNECSAYCTQPNPNGSGFVCQGFRSCDINADYVTYPARYPEVIAVGAIKSDNTISHFSSVGPKVELCAPGFDIRSTFPTWKCEHYPPEVCTRPGYASMNGTSMASPHVVGAAVLVKKAHSEFTHDQIRNTLKNTAVNMGEPNKYGYGRVDAAAAVGLMASCADPFCQLNVS